MAAGLANLREEYARSIDPARVLVAEALTLENELSDLVNVGNRATADAGEGAATDGQELR